MTDIIAAVLIILLSAVGLAACIKGVIELIFRPVNIKAAIFVDTKGLSSDKTEYAIRSLVQKVRYSYGQNLTKIIICDYGLDEESREICQRLCKEYEFVIIDSKKEDYEFLDFG